MPMRAQTGTKNQTGGEERNRARIQEPRMAAHRMPPPAATGMLDCVSSCGSTNVRRVDRHLTFPVPYVTDADSSSTLASSSSSPARSGVSDATAASSACYYAADAEAETSAGKSTQMLLAMAAMGGPGGRYGRRPAPSSYGSCAGWSAGSLTDHRPASPSPVCSPVSSNGGSGCGDDGSGCGNGNGVSSFVTPGLEEEQGQYGIPPSKGDFMKFSATPGHFRDQAPKHPALMDRRVEGTLNHLPPRFIHKATPARRIGRAQSSRDYSKRVRGVDAVDEWRLPKVSEEGDEAVDNKDWQLDTVSSRISSERDWNFESDAAYEGSNHSSSGCDHSDGEKCPVAVQRRTERRLQGSVVKPRGDFIHTKLIAWKDAQIAKIIDKLKKREASIDDWRKRKTAIARQKMRETEMKLEKKRVKAADKTQREIVGVQKKADKKKAKEQAATANEIAGVERTLEKMSRTGKLPWSLAFL